MYEAKINGMQDQLNRSQSEDKGMQEELSTSKLKMGELSSQLNSITVSEMFVVQLLTAFVYLRNLLPFSRGRGRVRPSVHLTVCL